MTHFRIDEIAFNLEERTLALGGKIEVLEPRVVALLRVLIEAEGKLVTRDTLIEQVWLSRVVGDGAINRCVSLLRNHFHQLDAGTQYIATLSKAGYKLVVSCQVNTENVPCHISTLEQVHSQGKTIKTLLRLTSKRFMFVGLLIILFVSYGVWIYVQPQAINPAASLSPLNAEPITSFTGVEYNLSTDSQGKRLLFHRKEASNGGMNQLWLFESESGSEKVLLEDDSAIASAQLSPSGEYLVYVLQNKQSCLVQLLTIETMKSRSLFECDDEAYQTFSWHFNSQDLFYRTRANKTKAYAIYHYNLNTQVQRQLTLPFTGGNTRGDHLLAHHPKQNKLAVVRYLDPQSSEIQIFDSRTYALLHKQIIDDEVTFVAWHPSHEWLLYPKGEQIFSYDWQQHKTALWLDTGKAIQSFSFGEIDNDKRQLYLSEYQPNSHIWRQSLKEGSKPEPWQKSSRREGLPKAANSSSQLMFLSNRSGAMQVFLSHQAQQAEALEIDLPLGFTRLEWSPEDNSVLFYHNKAFYLYDIGLRTLTPILSQQGDSYVANFADTEQKIIYSSHKSGQWQLWLHDLVTNKEQQLTYKGGYSGRMWQGQLFFSKFNDSGLWRKSLQGENEQLLIQDFDITNWLNWQIRGSHLYYFDSDTGVQRYDLKTGETKLVLAKSADFIHQYTVSADEAYIYYAQREPDEGDIYRLSFIE
jgi:transcriptional activator of cad operon